MNEVDETIAIDKQLSDNWTTTPIVRWWVPHETPTTAYVSLGITRGENFQASLESSPLVRHLGLINVAIFTPEGDGPRTGMTYAETIAALFHIKQLSYGSSGTITTRVPNVQEVGITDGWYRINIQVPYQRNKN